MDVGFSNVCMVIGKIIHLEVKIWLEINLMVYVIAYKKARLIGCDSTIILIY